MVIRIFFIFFLVLTFSNTSFSQKKKEEEVYPKNQTDSLKLEGVIIEAEKHLILENYAKALESFMVAFEMNPQIAAINFKIAEVYAKSEEGQKALPYGLAAIELAPKNKYYRLGLARIYRSIGFYIDAAKTYEELLQLYPADENGLYELAELYQLMGRKEDLFRAFDMIEAQLGVQEEIVRERQRLFMKEGKVDEAILEYEKLISAFPTEYTYQVEFISFLIQNRKLSKAEEAIKEIEASESISSRVMLLKSELLWMKGEVDQSLQLLQNAFETRTLDFESKFQILSNYVLMVTSREEKIKLTNIAIALAGQYPEEFTAQAFAGDLLYQIDNKEESLNYYLQASALNPANFSVWQNILNVESGINAYDSVIVHSEKALEYFPNQAILYYYAGTGYLISKDYQRAVRMLEQGIKYTRDPKLLTIFYGQIGDAYNSLDDQEKSFKAYEKALEQDPANDHVLNNYSYFLSLQGQNLEKALEMSSKLIDLHPENPTYLDTHGWVLYVGENYKEAEKYLKRAAELEPDGTILEHYGDVLFKLGKADKAIVQWELARDSGGASDIIEKKIADKKLYE